MSYTYDLEELKQAILFNTEEVLPYSGDPEALDRELEIMVKAANEAGERIKHYIGFEVSGRIHIGTGMATALKIKKLTDTGVQCHLFIANYHTFLNSKLDGKLETINLVASDYFGPVMLKCCEVAGCDMDLVKVVYATDLYASKVNGDDYFTFLMNFAKEITLSRVMKSVSITGKEAGESIEFGTLMYPVMQVADPSFMGVQIVHAGLDQRKCHVLMREAASKVGYKYQLKIGDTPVKPLAIHHSLLLSLSVSGDSNNREVAKMSKSKPDSAVWVHDSLPEIQRKLKKAYCPMPSPEESTEEREKIQAWNPLLDWSQNLIYPSGQIIKVTREERFGGDKTYETFEELKQDYYYGKLHPLDLKNGVANTLANWFESIRDFVNENPKGLAKLIEIGK
jgi:tyrosyl-tRNA synthetase